MQMVLRVMVTGGRDYRNRERVFQILDGLNVGVLIVGDAGGADFLARSWAKMRLPQGRVEEFEADWKKLGKKAGPVRNSRMIEEGRPDIVVAFPGGSGTADAVSKANAKNIKVWSIPDADVSEIKSEAPQPLKNLKCKPGDSILHIDGKTLAVTVYAEIGDRKIEEPALLALALYWSLENEDWRYKVTRRAKEKLEEMIEEEARKARKSK
jgi:hypothetical protein